ncbi:hypothetical protein [Streptomyces justiciae]|uniref:Uncharacterized protein n=1 Tax=Streptomyces justiciae TaxID=2780140 RepID=A0ABU3LKV8_9ACTN|nr:hypothetical protein [Streptomyces justiciae]MDT7839787.1 hypothetical protein [Streptomyces justiciae]
MQVALACWVVNTDAARTFGGHPPAKDEYRLSPDGTAVPDEDFTGRVMDHLAVCLHALDAPRTGPDGHLAITVPRTAS